MKVMMLGEECFFLAFWYLLLEEYPKKGASPMLRVDCHSQSPRSHGRPEMNPDSKIQ
jgi:hypothetical protein